MRRRSFISLLAAALAHADEDYKVYTDPPRLLLRAQRLRLLRRERERQAQRWLHFETLIAGKAQMPEPGFALALHYQISQQEASGKQAIAWAVSSGATDIRQIALVFDWCAALLGKSEQTQLAQKLERSLQSGVNDLASARTRAFAAVSLGDSASESGAKALQHLLTNWWRKTLAPALKSGDRTVSSSDMYPLLELMHVVRDNLQIEMRDDALPFFRDVPAAQLLSYYPARFSAPENEYRIPFYSGKGEPDLRLAALSRAADMSFVAYDNNVVESQFLQGWVSNDAFQMKSAFATPYELLWANPYQPGLSFHHLPLQFHDKQAGRLFCDRRGRKTQGGRPIPTDGSRSFRTAGYKQRRPGRSSLRR